MTEFTLAAQIRMPAATVDDDLLAFGKQLDTIACELKTVRKWLDEVSDLFHAEVERCATWPYDQDEWNRWDAQAYWQTVCRIEKETEIGAAFVRAHNAENLFIVGLILSAKTSSPLRPVRARDGY